MVHWIQHADNYEMSRPSDNFPISIWISKYDSEVSSTTYGLSIYVGGRRIRHGLCYDFETAESEAVSWLKQLESSIKELLQRESNHA